MPRSVPNRFLAMMALTPFLFASKCKKKSAGEEQAQNVEEVATPDVALQVASIEPDTVNAGTAFSAAIAGTGFQEGLSVMIGMSQTATVLDSNANQVLIDVNAMEPGTYDVFVENPDGTSHILRGGLFVDGLEAISAAPDKCAQLDGVTVYFNLDQSKISDDSLSQLLEHVECFQKNGAKIRIEGHCDERGTTEYNVALGQRRAETIERILGKQGISADRIQTVSYGEERPEVEGSDEQAWSRNRRAALQMVE